MKAKCIPTIHPAAVLREWKQRAVVVRDLRRAAHHITSREIVKPAWAFITEPTYAIVQEKLTWLLETLNAGTSLWLDFDLETRLGHISCVGVSWSRTGAICIPFMSSRSREGYWNAAEEAWIVWMLYKICCHALVKIRWQNGLYDAQYTYRHWLFIPRGAQDTMIAQHAVFSDLPKSLAFIASMYCDYFVYWKDEGKDFNSGGRDEKMGWIYNCEDCIYTREVGEVLEQTAEKLGLAEVNQFQQELFWPVLKAMTRGVRVVGENRAALADEIQEQISIREAFLYNVLGHTINPRSPTQMKALFYEDLRQPPIKTRAKKGIPGHVTLDDEALQKIAAREPLLRPIISAVADIRTLGIFLSNFVLARLDVDGRMRCSYNIGGSASGKSAPKTYRLSSSKNAFDCGTNLQNIPSEKSKSVGKASARAKLNASSVGLMGDPYQLPNVRSLFGPDPGMTFFDMDLDRADLQVVAWEVNDEMLKAVMRQGADIHLVNAYVLDGKDPPPLEELVEGHPKYEDHKGPMKMKREFAKVACHATNYVGSARTIAGHVGRSVHEVERMQKIWFGAHPGIRIWHNDVLAQITKRRYVENKFGYRWYIFDRIDSVLPEAVAWIPQSTVSVVINKIWMNVYKNLPEVEVLMQVHDSLAGQGPTGRKAEWVAGLKREARVVIPYDDPLVIPVGVATSEVNWGECA